MRKRLKKLYDGLFGDMLTSERALALAVCFVLNSTVYWGAMTINSGRELQDITTALDRIIPFDSRWVVIYLSSYLFWAVNYVLMARSEDWYAIMTAEAAAKLICGGSFLLLPSTNIRPEVLGDGICDGLMRFVYRMDLPTNLFPSIHCLESWLCYGAIRKRWDIPEWYRDFSCVFAILVCISTVLTAQHVVADVLAGLLLAEGLLRLSRRRHWGSRLHRWMQVLDRIIFCVES